MRRGPAGTTRSIDLDARDIAVDGRRVRFRVAGSGPPVVLVHGLAGSWRWWRPSAPALAERHTVYAVDLPGFGALRGERFSLAAAPDFLLGWLDALGLESAALVGHSMGGAVCAELAARAPSRVSRLVLVAPAFDLRPSLLSYALPLARAAIGGGPRFAPTLVLDTLRCGLLPLARASLELVRGGTSVDDLQAVAAPTLVVWGSRDPLVPPQTAELVAARLRDARVHVIERASHVPMMDAPAEFARAVLGHLRGGFVGA